MRALFFLMVFNVLNSQSPVARIHYKGGGDWYGNKTTFKNIFRFYEKQFQTSLPLKEAKVKLSDPKLFSYPVIYISGHGNIFFDSNDVSNLRTYLNSGGFLFIDDDFGIDKFIRKEMKKVLPQSVFIELPFSHDIYQFPFLFKKGLPKIHEHKGGQPMGYGLFIKQRMVAFYSFNTDISDGCEDKGIHKDSENIRLQALKMGTNILSYALNN